MQKFANNSIVSGPNWWLRNFALASFILKDSCIESEHIFIGQCFYQAFCNRGAEVAMLFVCFVLHFTKKQDNPRQHYWWWKRLCSHGTSSWNPHFRLICSLCMYFPSLFNVLILFSLLSLFLLLSFFLLLSMFILLSLLSLLNFKLTQLL